MNNDVDEQKEQWGNTGVNQQNNTDVDQRDNTDVDQRDNTDVDQRDNTDVDQRDNTDVDQWDNTDVDQRNNTDVDQRDNTDVDQRDHTGVDQQNDQNNPNDDRYENNTNMDDLNDLYQRNNSNDASQEQTIIDVYSLNKKIKSNCNVNLIDTDLVARSFSIDRGATSDHGRMFCGSPGIVLGADEVSADLLIWDTAPLSNVSTETPSDEAVLNNIRLSERIAQDTSTKFINSEEEAKRNRKQKRRKAKKIYRKNNLQSYTESESKNTCQRPWEYSGPFYPTTNSLAQELTTCSLKAEAYLIPQKLSGENFRAAKSVEEIEMLERLGKDVAKKDELHFHRDLWNTPMRTEDACSSNVNWIREEQNVVDSEGMSATSGKNNSAELEQDGDWIMEDYDAIPFDEWQYAGAVNTKQQSKDNCKKADGRHFTTDDNRWKTVGCDWLANEWQGPMNVSGILGQGWSSLGMNQSDLSKVTKLSSHILTSESHDEVSKTDRLLTSLSVASEHCTLPLPQGEEPHCQQQAPPGYRVRPPPSLEPMLHSDIWRTKSEGSGPDMGAGRQPI